jgi:hypothetical protein
VQKICTNYKSGGHLNELSQSWFYPASSSLVAPFAKRWRYFRRQQLHLRQQPLRRLKQQHLLLSKRGAKKAKSVHLPGLFEWNIRLKINQKNRAVRKRTAFFEYPTCFENLLKLIK